MIFLLFLGETEVDSFVKSSISLINVIPAKAENQKLKTLMDSPLRACKARLRGNDPFFDFLRLHQG